MYKYEIIIYWSNEDRTFVAEMPELPVAWPMATPMKPPSRAPTRPFSCGSIPPANLEIPFPNQKASASCWPEGSRANPFPASTHPSIVNCQSSIENFRPAPRSPQPGQGLDAVAEMGGWRMASIALRLQILAAGAGTFPGLIDGRHFEPRCLANVSKRRAALALRQPAVALHSP